MADPVPVQLPSNPFQFYRVTGYLNTFQTNNLLATSAKRITQLVTGIIETVLIPLYALIGICKLPGFTRDTEAATLALHNKVVALEAQKQLSVDEVRQSILSSKEFQGEIERVTALAIENALRSPKEGEEEKGEANPIRDILNKYIADNYAQIKDNLYGTVRSEEKEATEGLIVTGRGLKETLATLKSEIDSLRERVEENSRASSSGKDESSESSALPPYLAEGALADDLKEKSAKPSGQDSELSNQVAGIAKDLKQIQEDLNGSGMTNGLIAVVENLQKTVTELQSSRTEGEGSEKEVESKEKEKLESIASESLDKKTQAYIEKIVILAAARVVELREETERSQDTAPSDSEEIKKKLMDLESQIEKLNAELRKTVESSMTISSEAQEKLESTLQEKITALEATLRALKNSESNLTGKIANLEEGFQTLNRELVQLVTGKPFDESSMDSSSLLVEKEEKNDGDSKKKTLSSPDVSPIPTETRREDSKKMLLIENEDHFDVSDITDPTKEEREKKGEGSEAQSLASSLISSTQDLSTTTSTDSNERPSTPGLAEGAGEGEVKK